MCSIIHCGFPLYSEAQSTYPAILPENADGVLSIKAMNFQEHIWGSHIFEDTVLIASGYQYKSGWYGDNEFASQCFDRLTGCKTFDTSCQDRYALERLVLGPFHMKFREEAEKNPNYHIAGISHGMRKGILNLPHAMAPRIDAAVHLRCQFSHFEWVVGPDDAQWKDYVKEVDDFLFSKEYNAGEQLFKTVEAKIMEQLAVIKEMRDSNKRRQLSLLQETEEYLGEKGINLFNNKEDQEEEEEQPRKHLRTSSFPFVNRTTRILKEESTGEEEPGEVMKMHHLTFDEKVEKEKYLGDGKHDRIYVYITSDNDRVKEAFVNYLEDHDHIAVIRVKTGQIIQHAKYAQHLAQNGSVGAFTLTTDWYCLSLANMIFAWRRDTSMLSTFAQVIKFLLEQTVSLC
jgi:hypothetical protein